MIKAVLILVYLLGGELKIERKVYEDMAACNQAGTIRVKEISSHPHFQEGVAAACVMARVTEA